MLRARREIEIMNVLKRGPMTVKDLANEIGMNPRTVKCIIQDLNEARVTQRKSRHIELASV
jgi:DNA-binding IclR family transcriptional regulator